MMYLRILVEPKGKGRAGRRIAGSPGKQFVQTYEHSETRASESDIKAAIRKEIDLEQKFTAKAALSLTATFTVMKPKSQPKYRIRPIVIPDQDNYLKLLLDALNKYAFPDDRQIVQLRADKVYGETPMIEVWIEEVVT